MPHNDYAFRDEHGMPGAGTVPEPSILRQLDLAASQGIDGDNGGTWNPAAPIIIGGAGLAMTGWAQSTGGVATGPNAAPRALITATDVPAVWIAGARTRTVVFPLRDFGARVDEISLYQGGTVSYDEGSVPGTVITKQNTSLWSMSATTARLIVPLAHYRISMGNTPSGASFVPTLRFRVGQSATTASLTGMPGFRISRFNSSGVWMSTYDTVIPTWAATTAYSVGHLVIPAAPNSKQFRCSVAGTSGAAQPAAFGTATPGQSVTDGTATWICEVGPAGASGHYITLPLPATPAAYYAQGQYQDVTLPGNMVGSGSFFGQAGAGGQAGNFFVLDILDPSGTNNLFHSLRIAFTSAVFSTAL